MRNLPEEICLLQSLEHLVLTGSAMSSLPNNFGHLTNLRHLDLGYWSKLRTLPATFKQLTLLQHLDLRGCLQLSLESDILENMTNLQYLNLVACRELKDLPLPITNQASLVDTKLPINIGQLSKLREMRIGSPLLTSLPASIGNLSSLTSLGISGVKLQSLPTSLGKLSSLTYLNIYDCIKLESLPESVGHLIHLQRLSIQSCPIRELDFGRGLFTSSLCNLKHIYLSGTRVDKISISQDRCPGLQDLHLHQNHLLTEIEALPTTIKHIQLYNCEMLKNIRVIGDLLNLVELIIRNCPELDVLPSFAESTSLKWFEVSGCKKVEKIEGLQHCISLERLVAGIQEVLGIESLEYMEKLRRLELIGNKRSTVQHCVQTIRKWPEEVIIWSKAVSDAGALLNSSAFPNLSVVDSFSKKKINSRPELQQKHAVSNADAIMLCYVINCVSPYVEFYLSSNSDIPISDTVVDTGKWVCICVFTQRSIFLKEKFLRITNHTWLLPTPKSSKDSEVEKGVLVMGEEKRVEENFHQLLTLLKN